MKRLLRRLTQSFGRNLFDVYCDPITRRRIDALEDTVAYLNSRAPRALAIRKREDLIDFALERMPADGIVAEFGVHTGKSLRHIARRITPRKVYGFDSFYGNPEDWHGWNAPRGIFNLGGRLPKVPANAILIAGTFEEILPRFASESSGPFAFLHIDCDLYSSTRAVFDALGDRIIPGTLILFDEYFNYINWREHEYRAFQEFIAGRGLKYEYLAYSTRQALVEIR